MFLKTLCYGIFAIHLLLILIVELRKVKKPQRPNAKDFVTIVRPCSGVDAYFRDTVTSGFKTGDWPCKFIFCVASPNDPAYAVLETIAAEHSHLPIVILSTEKNISFNPKLNNLAQSWTHIEGDYLLIVDSNVRFEDNYLVGMMGKWRNDVGLLTSPPAGVEPRNFAAHLEAGFLNSYQDLWQLSGDSLGNGFAQGKVLFWRKEVLEDGGGLPALGHDLAEDVASTKLTKRMGYRIRLLKEPVSQPLGQRRFKAVWQRQVRWAKVRRFGFPLIYAMEILSFAATWWVVGIVAIAMGALDWKNFGLCFMIWYFAEYLLARVYNWPRSWRDVLAWIVRDILLPSVWTAGYWGRSFKWQGHKMSNADIKKLRQTDA